MKNVIADALKKTGMTRTELREALGGYSESAISLWLSGKRKPGPAVCQMVKRIVAERLAA